MKRDDAPQQKLVFCTRHRALTRAEDISLYKRHRTQLILVQTHVDVINFYSRVITTAPLTLSPKCDSATAETLPRKKHIKYRTTVQRHYT